MYICENNFIPQESSTQENIFSYQNSNRVTYKCINPTSEVGDNQDRNLNQTLKTSF